MNSRAFGRHNACFAKIGSKRLAASIRLVFTFVPAPCTSGTDSFTYSGQDENLDDPLTATVTLHIGARPAGSH